MNSLTYNKDLADLTFRQFRRAIVDLNLKRKDILFLWNKIEDDQKLTRTLSIQHSPYFAYFSPGEVKPALLYHQHDPLRVTKEDVYNWMLDRVRVEVSKETLIQSLVEVPKEYF